MKHLNDNEIQDYLDGNLFERESEIAAHLDLCPTCSEKAKHYILLINKLGIDTVPELSDNFVKSVMARIPANTVVTTESNALTRPLVYSLSSLAAALLALIYFFDFGSLLNSGRLTGIHELFNGLVSSIYKGISGIIPFEMTMIISVGLALLAIAGIDYIIRHNRQKPVSYMLS